MEWHLQLFRNYNTNKKKKGRTEKTSVLENNCWVCYTSNPILLLGSQNGVFQFSHPETNHTRPLNDPDGMSFVKAFEISTIVLFHGWIFVGVLLQSAMLKQSVKLPSREMTE